MRRILNVCGELPHCLTSRGDARANRCHVWPALDSMLLAILMRTQSSLELMYAVSHKACIAYMSSFRTGRCMPYHYARAIPPRDLKAPNVSEHFGSLDVYIQNS